MKSILKLFLLVFVIVFILAIYVNPFNVWAGEKTDLPNTTALEARLKTLEDREEIRQLLLDYGRFLDQRDFKSFSELFAKTDREWIGGMGKAKGCRPYVN